MSHQNVPRLFDDTDCLPLLAGTPYGPAVSERNATQDAAQHQATLPTVDLRPVFGQQQDVTLTSFETMRRCKK